MNELKTMIRTLREYLIEAHEPDKTARGTNGLNHGGDGKSGCTYCEAISQAGRLLKINAPQRKVATLDPLENESWVDLFTYAKESLRYGDDRADAYAWRNMQATYPRLRAFDGCRAAVSKGRVSL